MAANDEPPFLNVGTEVSAKYRGAFCEATIKIAKKLVKCKLSYAKGHTETVPNDVIKGPLKIGANVEVRQNDGQYLPATIVKLTDASTYTVVFDDGDERTLKRSSLCLKGGRHYSESESLDQMPLTDPENFGTPVHYQTKRGTRRRRHPSQSSSPEAEGPSPSKKPAPTLTATVTSASTIKTVVNPYSSEFPVGRCVFLENDRRRSCWLPAVVVPAHYVMDESEVIEDTICIRSFKDGRFFAAKASELHAFAPDKEPLSSMLEGEIQPMYMCKPAIEKAMAYLDTGELPWDMELFESKEFSSASGGEQDDNEMTDKQKADMDSFYERLKKFQDEKGIVSHRQPSLAQRDLDLYKLYRLVRENGGMEKVTQELKWQSLYLQMSMPELPNSSYLIKQAYKRHLNAFEIYEKAKEEGKPLPIKNSRKRLAAQDSNEDLEKTETKQSKQEKQDRQEKLDKPEKQAKPNLVPQASSVSQKSDQTIESDSDTAVSQADSSTAVVLEEIKEQSNGEGEDGGDKGKLKIADGDKIKVGDRISVWYGRGKTLQTYEAKILEIDESSPDHIMYYVHYNGWNTRYDEWIEGERIAGKTTSPSKGSGRPSYTKKKNAKLKTIGKNKNGGTRSESPGTKVDPITTPISTSTTPTNTETASYTRPPKGSTGKSTRRRRTSSATETSSNSDVAHSPVSNALTSSTSFSQTKHSSIPTALTSPLPCSPNSRVPPILSPDGSYDTLPLKAQPESTHSSDAMSSEDDQSFDVKKEENSNWFETESDTISLKEPSETGITTETGMDIEEEELVAKQPVSQNTPSMQEMSALPTQTDFTDMESSTISLSSTTIDPSSSATNTFSLFEIPSTPAISTSAETTQPSSPRMNNSDGSPVSLAVSSPESDHEITFVSEEKPTPLSSNQRNHGTPNKRRGHDSGVENSSESDGAPEAKRAARNDLDFSIDMSIYPDLSSSDRIALIQERMKAIQKRYMELKAEVTYLDRKRRRARRKEREVARLLATQQDNLESTSPSLSATPLNAEMSSETIQHISTHESH